MVSDFLNPLISAVAGLSGVFLGGWLSDRRERAKQHRDLVTRQLSEFYGPLVALRAEILARANLRVKLEQALNSIYSRETGEAQLYNREARNRIFDVNKKMLSTVIEDEEKIFRETVLPLYRKMLSTLQDKMWLAEPKTRTYVPEFVDFLDVWERHVRGTIPGDLVREIGHTEEKLHPFYGHLEETHDRLQSWLLGKPTNAES